MKVQTAAILVHDIFATKQFTTVIVTMSEADNVKRDERPPMAVVVKGTCSRLCEEERRSLEGVLRLMRDERYEREPDWRVL